MQQIRLLSRIGRKRSSDWSVKRFLLAPTRSRFDAGLTISSARATLLACRLLIGVASTGSTPVRIPCRRFQTLRLQTWRTHPVMGRPHSYAGHKRLRDHRWLVMIFAMTSLQVALLWRTNLLEQKASVEARSQEEVQGRSWFIGLASLFFILLQSACTALMAISGLRLLIGIGSLAAATTGLKLLASIHGELIRIPMEIIAIAGALINLYAVWRVRSLRARPSSQWRVGPVTSTTRRAEWIQVALALVTLVLVAIEWLIHIHLHGSI